MSQTWRCGICGRLEEVPVAAAEVECSQGHRRQRMKLVEDDTSLPVEEEPELEVVDPESEDDLEYIQEREEPLMREMIDGVPVLGHEATFKGKFEVDPEVAEKLGFDRTAMVVVLVRVGAPAFRADKSGDLHRKDALEIKTARVISDGAVQSQIADMLGINIQGRFEFSDPPALGQGQTAQPGMFAFLPDGEGGGEWQPSESETEVVKPASKPRDSVLADFLSEG